MWLNVPEHFILPKAFGPVEFLSSDIDKGAALTECDVVNVVVLYKLVISVR